MTTTLCYALYVLITWVATVALSVGSSAAAAAIWPGFGLFSLRVFVVARATIFSFAIREARRGFVDDGFAETCVVSEFLLLFAWVWLYGGKGGDRETNLDLFVVVYLFFFFLRGRWIIENFCSIVFR